MSTTSWPARAYAYGTWGYALARAREHAEERRQRVYLYRGALDGEPVWVAAWDPKPTRVTPPAPTPAAREDRAAMSIDPEPPGTTLRPFTPVEIEALDLSDYAEDYIAQDHADEEGEG